MSVWSTQAVNVAGVLFSPPRSTKGIPYCWTLARQPVSRSEQKAASIVIDANNQETEDGSGGDVKRIEHLWDQRFFIRIQHGGPSSTPLTMTTSQLLIRPLAMDDVRQVNHPLESQEHGDYESRDRLEAWMAQVPGKSRFTIPVVSSVEGNKVLSLPTLGIHLHPSPVTVNSWFKSRTPQDGQDSMTFATARKYGEEARPAGAATDVS